MFGIELVGVSDIGNDLLNWIQDKATFLAGFLPTSPFRKAIDLLGNIPYIEEINWFIPIHEAVMILEWWGLAIGVYYGYMVVLRWVKAIE